MADQPLQKTTIGKPLDILAEMDASAGVSYLERSRLRRDVLSTADDLDEGTISRAKALGQYADLQDEVTALDDDLPEGDLQKSGQDQAQTEIRKQNSEGKDE